MKEKDIRWVQRFSNYQKALRRLDEAIEIVSRKTDWAESIDDLLQEGLIQRFEYTHELAWKVMKDYAEYHRRRKYDCDHPEYPHKTPALFLVHFNTSALIRRRHGAVLTVILERIYAALRDIGYRDLRQNIPALIGQYQGLALFQAEIRL